MEEKILEEIGLTKGEISVYLALLELGSSTVGPIVEHAKVSSSKVYDILERLLNKGMASFVIKENTKYFEGSAPRRILEYLEEKKKSLAEQEDEIKKILPQLELKQKLNELKSQAHVFKGNKGFLTAFRDIIYTLKKGEELLVMGIFDFDPEFKRMIINFHKERADAGIKASFLINFGATDVGDKLLELKHTKIKYMQKGLFTPAVFLIYKNKILISLPNERTFFRIENKEAYTSFKAYFELLWRRDVSVLEGKEGVTSFFTNILSDLKKGEEYFVINANHLNIPELKSFFKDYHKKRGEKGIKANLLVNTTIANTVNDIVKSPAEYRFLPPDFKSPLQIVFYKNKLYIIVWGENPIGFLIEKKNIADSFKDYFDTLWNQDVITLKGNEGIKRICDEVIKENKDLYLIGANAILPAQYPSIFGEWEKQRVRLGIKRYHLSTESTRHMKFADFPGMKFNELPNTEARYLPKEFNSPMVIWVFGNKVAHVLWDKEIIFLIDNKQVADDYRNYFNMLWKISKV